MMAWQASKGYTRPLSRVFLPVLVSVGVEVMRIKGTPAIYGPWVNSSAMPD